VLVSDASEYGVCINIFKTKILMERKIFSSGCTAREKKYFSLPTAVLLFVFAETNNTAVGVVKYFSLNTTGARNVAIG
tara:strand:- start:471 stop:704 length:234 start_codon:yes stop_codon:yes gene_type:complete